jgi:UDP-glucose 4-epimerase
VFAAKHSKRRLRDVEFPGFATVLKHATKVPSLLIPRRLESRLKPLHFENRRLRETKGWTPPLDYQQCLARTYGPEAPPGAISNASLDVTRLASWMSRDQ